MRVLKSLLTTAAVAATMIGSTVQAGDMKIALVVKALILFTPVQQTQPLKAKSKSLTV
jgi:hypothetical protein